MSIDHSSLNITLMLGTEECIVRPLRPLDILDVIEWANHRERKAQLELINPRDVEEAARALKLIGKPYSIDNMEALLNEPMILTESLWRCYLHANPGSEREAFLDKLTLLDFPRLVEFFNRITGYGDQNEDPTPAAAESEKKSTASAKSSPPSVKDTKD